MYKEIYLENTNYNPKTGKHHSKFYQMVDNNANNTWTATWGKIGALNPQSKVYPMSNWHSMLDQKLANGYEYAHPTQPLQTEPEPAAIYNVDRYNKVKNSIDELMNIIGNYVPVNGNDVEYKERENDLDAVDNIRKSVISDKKCSKDTLKYLLMLHNQYI